MLQRAACNLLPNGCYYGSFQRAAARKLRQVFRAEPITTDRKICHVRRETLHTLQSMPPAAQVRRSSRNTSYAAVTDHGVSGATSASLLQAAKQEAAEESLESPMPVLDENTTDASRKRRRIAPKAKIAADGAGVVPAELPQAQHQVTAADKALHDSAKAHKGRKSRAKPAIQPEAAVATGILAHPSTTASETGTATQTASRPAKGRMPKQPQAAVEEQTSAITAASGLTHTHPSTAAPATPKPMRTSKQTKSTPTVKTESADLDNSAGTAAHIAAAAPDTSTRNSKPPRRARQTKGKTAVKSEPAELDQLANEAPDATAVVSDTTKAMPACQGKQTKAKTAVKREPAELDPIANTARHASAEGPITDATEAVPAAEPRRPRAKAAVKVDIAEVIASLNVTPYRDRVKPDKWVGAHVSMGGGLERAVVRAAAIGANAFAMDTRSKRRWDSPPIDVDRAAAFRQACEEFGFGREHILPHGSYLINLATADPDMYVKSYNAFVDELQRCETLGLGLYNFHPGSTCGKCPAEEGMDRIADAINRAHAKTTSVVIVLENMAGAGHSVGHKFEYLRYIIDKVHNKDRVGVCLDTCHLFAGGYDVSTSEAFEQVMKEFDKEVGLQYLKGMHVNDSKAALGSKKDRHENVAKGLIGHDCFAFIMNDSRFNGIPLIMETPVQCEGPNLDYKLSLLAGAAVFKGPAEADTGENTDKRDIAWLNSLAKP